MSREQCPDRSLLAAIHDGKLSEAELDTWAAHIERCEQCVTVLESLRESPPADEEKTTPSSPIRGSVWQRLKASGILEPDQIATLQADAEADGGKDSDQDAIRWLARHGALTQFQAAALLAGRDGDLVLGEYVLIDQIGAGGMGQVFKALHKRMDRVVALKVMSPALVQTPESVRRFQREVRAAAKLMHPNIVTAFDASEWGGRHFLVMEYVDGQDLASLLRERRRFPIDETLRFLTQAAQGLAYAHDHGLVHRDVKPANLMLDREGAVKILDMGLARLENARAVEELTQSGQVMGTLDYMAPEQAVNPRDADARSDIYSLGCTLYRLMTGKTPYSGESVIERLVAHRESPIPSLRASCADAPPELEAVFRRMVAKQPQERFQSMREVVEALHKISASKASSVHLKSATTRHRSAAIAVAGAAVLIGIAFIAASGWRWLWPDRSKTSSTASAPIPDANRSSSPTSVTNVSPPGVIQAPELLKAPFDDETAKKQQRAWAEYLKQSDASADVEIETRAGIKLRLIPPGEFKLGSTEAEVARYIAAAEASRLTARYGVIDQFGQKIDWHAKLVRREAPQMEQVKVTRPFYLSKYEITVEQFRQFVEEMKHQTDAERDGAGGQAIVDGRWDQQPQYKWSHPTPAGQAADDEPVVQVSHQDAEAFCRWLNDKTGRKFRLPNEVAWEYACRAGTESAYSFGNDATQLGDYGWGMESGGARVHPVGMLKPNTFGLYDMHGNAWEWIDSSTYTRGLISNSPDRSRRRLICGGSFAYVLPETVRSAFRDTSLADSRNSLGGFRVMMLADDVPSDPVVGTSPSIATDRDIALWVLQQGGSLGYLKEGVSHIAYQPVHLPKEDFKITGIGLHHCRGLRRPQLQRLTQLTQLSHLDLSGSDVTDDDLQGVLSTLKNLRDLSFDFTSIHDRTLDEVQALPKLIALGASGTQITQSSLLNAKLQQELVYLGIGHLSHNESLQNWIEQQRSLDNIVIHASWLRRDHIDRLLAKSTVKRFGVYGDCKAESLALLEDYPALRSMFLMGNDAVSRDHLERLFRNPHLATVGFCKSKLANDWFAALSEQGGLKNLEVNACPVDDGFLTHLGKYRDLEAIWLKHVNVSKAGIAALQKECPKIYVIHNEREYAPTASKSPDWLVAQWVLALGGSVYVKDGELGRRVEDPARIPLFDFRLNVVDLKECRGLNGEHIEQLAQLPELRFLFLTGSDIDDDLLRTRLRKFPKLNRLKLDRTSVGDAIFAELPSLTQLQELDLSGTNVTEDQLVGWSTPKGMQFLGIGHLPWTNRLENWVHQPRGVTNLDCHHTWIEPEILQRLFSNTKVRSLGIYGDLPAEKLQLLAPHRTETLYILSNQAVTQVFVENLLALPNITTLGLEDTPVRSEWFATLPQQTRLKNLEIEKCGLDDAFLQHLSKFPAISSVSLRFTDVTQAAIERYQGKHPSPGIYWQAWPPGSRGTK